MPVLAAILFLMRLIRKHFFLLPIQTEIYTERSTKVAEAGGALIYAMWGNWKEHNRRVFRNVALLPEAVG